MSMTSTPNKIKKDISPIYMNARIDRMESNKKNMVNKTA